jgi:hypothetical protein
MYAKRERCEGAELKPKFAIKPERLDGVLKDCRIFLPGSNNSVRIPAGPQI